MLKLREIGRRREEDEFVTTGLFDDRGLVEVTSADLREGMLVEVPTT